MSAVASPSPQSLRVREGRARIDSRDMLLGMSSTAHDLANRLNALTIHLELARSALDAAVAAGAFGTRGREHQSLLTSTQRGIALLGARNGRLRARLETAIRDERSVDVPEFAERKARSSTLGPVTRGGAVYAAMLRRQVAALHRRIEKAARTIERNPGSREGNAAVMKRLRFIVECSADMLRAKDELLALSEGNLDARPFDPRQVTQRAWDLIQSQLRSTAKATLNFTDVRPILGAPGQFMDAVLNLMVNAHQALADCPEKVLSFRLFQDGDWAVFESRDSGMGLPPDAARIFEPFFTTKANGTGRGLANVQRIVSGLGGRVIATAVGDDDSPFNTLFRIEVPTLPFRALAASAK